MTGWFRRKISKQLAFSLKPLLRYREKLLGRSTECYESCLLSGSEELRLQFRSAISQLKGYDCELALEFLKTPWLVYDSGEKARCHLQSRTCGISTGWLQWGEQGILAVFVYAQILLRISRQKSEFAAHEARQTTAKWLMQHEFHAGIVDSFEVPSQ